MIRVVTPARVRGAFVVAVATDLIQLMMGPLGWAFADEVIDVAAAGVISWLIGFHPLLLPTFVLEFFPVVDMLPTWTACVALVVTLKKRQQMTPPPPPPGPVIDV